MTDGLHFALSRSKGDNEPMENKFILSEYAERLFKELVLAFDSSNHATHPGAVGNGKEKSVMKRLELLLPEGVGIGQGFVYDLNGTVSRQCDIILYEKDYCLKAVANEDEANTYFNCESVIAVGEIKSKLVRSELEDCLNKFTQLSELSRDTKYLTQPFRRPYLSKTVHMINASTMKTGLDQILKFIICEKVEMSENLICATIKDMGIPKSSMPNELIDLRGFSISYLDGASITIFPTTADLLVFQKDEHPSDTFSRFLYHLVSFINSGLTIPLNYDSYYRDKAKLSPKKTAELNNICR